MIKLNESSTGKTEIGSSVNSNRLEYASIKKFSMGNDDIKLSKLKLFYEREECLIAMQFILQDKLFFGTSENFIYMEPKILGPDDTFKSSKSIDEIILNFSPDEEIYLIKGTYFKHKIIRLGVYTTFGQFAEFGKSNNEYNFQWEYFYNLKYFDGFIIGWDDLNINYLASLIYEKSNLTEDERSIQLTDTTYEIKINTNPIYQTPMYGTIEPNTTIEDDIFKLNIMKQIKENVIHLTEIAIYYSTTIDRIDTEYTNFQSGEKLKVYHVGSNYSKENCKRVFLKILEGDYVNQIKITYDIFVESILFKTRFGKSLNCIAQEGENVVEY